ncbi:hypothetical protein D3C85_1362700 [compost metagenome]
MIPQFQVGGGEGVDRRILAGIVEMRIPQHLLVSALANFIFLHVILTRALEPASIAAAHNVDFIFVSQPLDAGGRGGLLLGHFDAYPLTIGVQSVARLLQFRAQIRCGNCGSIGCI